MWKTLENEPVMVGALVLAVVQLATSFGIDVTPEQEVAIDAVVVALIPIVGLFVRGRVKPVGKISAAERDSLDRG